MKVNGSFNGIKPSDNNSAGKRIAKAAIIAGAVVGGAALCSRGKKNSALQKLANVLTNDILSPLKQKGVPLNEKIANIGENLKQAVSSLMSKRNGYDDILEIMPARLEAGHHVPLALPEKGTAFYGEEIQKSLENLLYKGDGKPVFDIPVVIDVNASQSGKILALPAPKNVLALPEKAGNVTEGVVQGAPRNVIQPETSEVIQLPSGPAEATDKVLQGVAEALDKIKQGFAEIAAEMAQDAAGKSDKIFAAAGLAGAALTGSAALAAANKKDDEPVIKTRVPVEEPPEEQGLGFMGAADSTEEAEELVTAKASKVLKPARPVKHDKIQIVTLNGKEFGGIFEDGIAYDEECEPLTGKLVADFESGKAAVLQYEDGVLQKSLIFKHKEDEAPKEIKTYKNGRIHQKFEDITLENGAFVAKTTSTYRADDSMLQRIDVNAGKLTRAKHFKNTTDESGKISGAPTPTLSTSVKRLSNGVERRKFYAYTPEGKRVLARISDTQIDGTKHIRLIGNDKQPAGEIRLDEDKKIRHYITSPTGDPSEGYLYIEDGKLNYATTEMTFGEKEDIATYLGYRFSGSKFNPSRPLKKGEKEEDVPGERTSFYKAESGEILAITRYDDGSTVKTIETFAKEGDTEPTSSVTYPKSKNVHADYHMRKSSITGEVSSKVEICRQAAEPVIFPPLEKLDCSDEEVTVFRKRDGSVIEVEHDKEGYITSIASYIDEETMHPECVTTFDHGTPLKDTVYDVDGNVILSAKYSVKPVPKQEAAEEELPLPVNKADYQRDLDGYTKFNDTYNVKTFYGQIWADRYYQDEPVKEIRRDENDVYEVSLLNPYDYNRATYKIMLDENGTVQRLKVYDSAGKSSELYMDEEGHLELDDLRYAVKTGELTHVGPFKDNMERYRTRQGEVIEFVKNEDGTVASFAYYDDEKSDIPVCRTFLKGGAPTTDVVYDREDGAILHTSDYDKDMEDVENPLEDKYYYSGTNPLGKRLFKRDGSTF